MSFIQKNSGIGYASGWFLAEAECARESCTVSASHAQVVTRPDGSKYVPAGAVIPSNDGNAKGILFEDVDVSTGNMPGSLVTRGTVYEDRLPAAIEASAEAVLTGIKVITTSPAAIRPTSFGIVDLAAITVTSQAGSASGKTNLAVSGYTLKAGESYVYKYGAAAPAVAPGQYLPTSGTGAWTAAAMPANGVDGTSGQKVTVAAVDSTGAAVAAGNTSVVAND